MALRRATANAVFHLRGGPRGAPYPPRGGPDLLRRAVGVKPYSSYVKTKSGVLIPSAHAPKGPPTYNKKVPSGNGWDSFIGGFISAAPLAAYGMVFGGLTFTYFYVIPTLDRIDSKVEAFNKKLMLQQNERRAAALNSLGSHIEGTDVVGEFSKGQRIQASGQDKD